MKARQTDNSGWMEERGERERHGCTHVIDPSVNVEESIALGALQSEGVSYTDAVYAATIVYQRR